MAKIWDRDQRSLAIVADLKKRVAEPTKKR